MSARRPDAEHTDVVVVGSGLGRSTAALRLTEKGYRVTVLEAGRRFADVDIPMTAHFLGGWAIGATPEDGVVDPYHLSRDALDGSTSQPRSRRPVIMGGELSTVAISMSTLPLR